jgi:bacterioferritin-associated ferredoxin
VIVCHCEVVSDRSIRQHCDQGAVTADEIAERCGAGARCGSCRPSIVALLATHVVPERAQPAA